MTTSGFDNEEMNAITVRILIARPGKQSPKPKTAQKFHRATSTANADFLYSRQRFSAIKNINARIGATLRHADKLHRRACADAAGTCPQLCPALDVRASFGEELLVNGLNKWPPPLGLL